MKTVGFMQLKSFWLRRCVRSSAMNVLSAYRRRRSAAASRSPPVNRWHLRQTNAGIMGVLTQNTLVWGTRKPPNLGIHFPRKTANRQWINRPNRWRDRNTCGPQSTSCILFIYPEYGQLLHLHQAKNGKMVGGLWGVVYVYKAIFIGGLPKLPCCN